MKIADVTPGLYRDSGSLWATSTSLVLAGGELYSLPMRRPKPSGRYVPVLSEKATREQTKRYRAALPGRRGLLAIAQAGPRRRDALGEARNLAALAGATDELFELATTVSIGAALERATAILDEPGIELEITVGLNPATVVRADYLLETDSPLAQARQAKRQFIELGFEAGLSCEFGPDPRVLLDLTPEQARSVLAALAEDDS